MHRFYLPPDECQKDSITLSERESRHALNVLRIRPRDRVIVLNGAGDEMLCEVREADRRAVRLKIVRKNPIPPLPCRLTLAQAVTRGRTMELIVQKATELGAHRIVPILSERTVAHVGADRAAAKVEKWEATTIEAIKQCGAAWLPRVEFREPLMEEIDEFVECIVQGRAPLADGQSGLAVVALLERLSKSMTSGAEHGA